MLWEVLLVCSSASHAVEYRTNRWSLRAGLSILIGDASLDEQPLGKGADEFSWFELEGR